jgi:type II secretory pathway component PulF
MNYALWSAKRAFAQNRAEFYEDLAEALEDKAELIKYLQKKKVMAGRSYEALIYARWISRLDKSLAEAMHDTVPPTDIMIIQAAEQSGQIPKGLRFLSSAVTASKEMRGAILGAIGMPCFLFLLLTWILCLLAVFLMPILTQIMKPDEFPAVGKALYHLSMFISGYGLWMAPFIAGGVVLFIWSLNNWHVNRRPTGDARRVLDDFLPYSIFRDYNGPLALVSLAALMQGGRGVSESLSVLRDSASPWLRAYLARAISRLNTYPDNPAKALDTGMFSRKLTIRVIEKGERSGFQEAIASIGVDAVQQTTKEVKKSAAALNLLMIIFVGGCLGFIVIGTVLTAQHASAVIRQSVQAHGR